MTLFVSLGQSILQLLYAIGDTNSDMANFWSYPELLLEGLSTACQARSCVRGYARHGNCEGERYQLQWQAESKFFLFSAPHWIPAFHTDHEYTWMTSVYAKIPSQPKAQEDSQETGRNKGRLQTFKLVSQNCPLETCRMTLKSPRLSQSLNYNSRVA